MVCMRLLYSHDLKIFPVVFRSSLYIFSIKLFKRLKQGASVGSRSRNTHIWQVGLLKSC
ncbi:hypothetical protein Hdeb2414_s0002g00073891 [Helianthus debilis subsp. tardiflorus]